MFDSTVRIDEDSYKEFYVVCKGLGYSRTVECVQDAIDLLLKTVKDGSIDNLSPYPTGDKYIYIAVEREKYMEFVDICKKLGMKKWECIRAALELWVAKNKNNAITFDAEAFKTKTFTFKVERSLLEELKTICKQRGSRSIAQCIRDAILLWLKNPTKSNGKDPRGSKITTSFKIDPELFQQFEVTCINNGYSSTAQCIRDAIRLWIAMNG